MINKHQIKTVAFFLLFCLWANGKTFAQIDITLTGNWVFSVSATDISEAGRDFTGTHLSAANQVLVDIFRTQGNSPFNWKVDVRKSDVDWVPSLQLFVRRTGDGYAPNGSSSISGGITFQLLTNTNQAFFNGRRNYYDIPIQFQLSGVSVLLPSKTYSTTVMYTVTEL